MNIAGIDCGTNTVKLLIAERTESGLRELVREVRVVRLGQDLDRTGVLAEEALQRAFATVEEYAVLIREHDVERVRFVATSATRDAANARVFVDGVRQRLGVEPDVVTGAEEAALAFGGVARNLRREPTPPVMVIDIGGGSTELIEGHRTPVPVTTPPAAAHSMDIGAVRLTERHLRSDPPTPAELDACVRDIEEHLDACPVDPAGAGTVVGVAGTVIQLAAGILGLTAYDREVVDQAELAADDVHAMVERLAGMRVEERRALPWMHPGRADVVVAGGVILGRILRRTRVESLIVSESDILDGITWSVRD